MNNQPLRLALSLAIAAICAAQPTLAEPGTTPAGAPQSFAVYDADGNGVVTELEFNAVRAQQARDRVAAGVPEGRGANTTTFAVFDLDHNGQVTAAEFATVQPESVTPVPGTMGAGPKMGLSDGRSGNGPASFADLDENKDGAISAAEFNDARANRAVERSQEGYALGSLRNAPPFGTFDANGDGKISPAEYAKVQAEHAQPPQPQPMPMPAQR